MKDSMIVYATYLEKFRRLSDQQFGCLMRAAMEYQMTGEVPSIDDMAVSVAFDIVKYDLDVNRQKYDEVCEKRREAGAKGGLAKASKTKQMLPNATKCYQMLANGSKPKQNVHDTDTEYDNESDTDNDTETVNDKGVKKVSAKALTEEVVAEWNSYEPRGIIPKVNSMSSTSTRYRMLQARIAEHGIDGVKQAIRNVFESSFLQSATWFSFDWFVKPNNFVKVADGNYNDRKTDELPRGFKAVEDMGWENNGETKPIWEMLQ